MSTRMPWLAAALGIVALIILPWLSPPSYFLHIVILILIWGFIYTAWSLMGKFGLVSLGHGAFVGAGAYASGLLWNFYGLTPWLGIPIGMGLAVLLAIVIGYPCFRLKVVGHYFALVTLALAEVARLSIVAARDITGGSLGMTPAGVPTPSWFALQFADKRYFYFLALGVWLFGLWVWRRMEASMASAALEAISEDEGAAAAIGIHVTRHKLYLTIVSAGLTALGGALYSQFVMYLNPDTLAGVGVSLQIVFAAIAGGMYSMLGPTVGAVLTIVLGEALRVWFGTTWIGAANTIYGILLVIFIIYMPRGIVGLLTSHLRVPNIRIGGVPLKS
jgi:branched-chain amino acid transport system permease protein